MIRKAWRATIKFVGSAPVATWLLVLVGAWSMVASFVPQSRDSAQTVATWAAAHPAIEPLVRTLGLHQAFSSLGFTLLVAALGVSTAVCAWRRTKAAISRMGTLRKATSANAWSLRADHDFEITCDSTLSAPKVLSTASDTLGTLGIKTKRKGDMLSAVSSPWSVWGSPVFHWALLALIVVVLGGTLQRSEGLMGVAVGQVKPDAPQSYGQIHTGPLHNWAGVHRSIRLDSFDPNYRAGNIDRGPTPIVSVLDRSGRVVKTQHVYPNMPLQTGSLTIHPSGFGLSATVVRLNASGAETGRSVQLVDFSEATTSGTAPVGFLVLSNEIDVPQLKIFVTVPLDRSGDFWIKGLPMRPTARVVVTSIDGRKLLERVANLGESVPMPVGGSVRVDDIGWYARLLIVDDQSIPLLYAGIAVMMIGLTLSVVARQQLVLLAVVEEPEGPKLIASVRLWRNTSTSRREVESELVKALRTDDKESMS